jgi:parvulin-like peptidyl-prolyl isomerase
MTNSWGVPALARMLVLAAALMLGLLLATCQRSERTVLSDASVHAIAVVNNERIGYEDFQNAYQLFLTQWDAFIQNDAGKKQQLKEMVLQELIDGKLLDQEARRRGIQVSDEELNARVQELIAPMDQNDLRQAALAAHSSAQTWMRDYQRRLVHRKLIQQEVIDKVRVTGKELRDLYNRNPRRFARLEQVKVRHICVGSRDLYDRVMKAIDKGEDFVTLVKKYSITPDRASDGELGYIQKGMLPPELETAIFELKRVGAVSSSRKPVQTQMGFHIFRVEGYRPEGMRTFEDAEPDIRAVLVNDREPEAYKRWLENLRKSATITLDHKLLNAETG